MSKAIETNPFMEGMLKHAKQQVRRCEDECNRKDPQKNAGCEMEHARRELSDLLSQQRQGGYKV